MVDVGGKYYLCSCPPCITFCAAKLRGVRGAIWFSQDDRNPTYLLTAVVMECRPERDHLESLLSCGLNASVTTVQFVMLLQLSISVLASEAWQGINYMPSFVNLQPWK